MAVQDKYISPNAAAKKENPALFSGGRLLCVAFNFEVAAADDDGSVYRIGKLPANAIPVLCNIYSDVITSSSDWDLGLYKPGVSGAVVDKDIFMDGGDPSGGKAITAPLNGLTNLGGADVVASIGKKLWELLGLSAPSIHEYDLALTANTVGSLAGTVSGVLWYIQG